MPRTGYSFVLMNAAETLPSAHRWIRRWLILIGLMVYAMILIGGATRLTDSGLSITEWEPIKGTLPPLGDAAWQEAFAKYQTTSEFRLVNNSMTLDEFKFIYFWEWGHRLFGRLIGLVAVVGLGIFAWRRWLGQGLGWKLLGLVGLGGLQGLIGWWMVSSGIGETARVDVAPYRLMTHFMLALAILGVTFWLWLDLGGGERRAASPGAQRFFLVFCGLVAVQMATGALVAGLDAGRTYTDWPKMAGEWVPSGYLDQLLGWRSLFEGRAATQFNHRLLAYLILALSLGAAWFFRKSALRRQVFLLASAVSLQAVWGVLTLLNAAPLSLALVHQGLGVIVFLLSLNLVWRLSAPAKAV